MPLPGTPHPKMVIQPLTFVALILAKNLDRVETQHAACDNSLKDVCEDGAMGLKSEDMNPHDVHDKPQGQGDADPPVHICHG